VNTSLVVVLASMLCSPLVLAQDASPPVGTAVPAAVDTSSPHIPELVSHPPLRKVQWAMEETNFSDLQLTVEVQWDGEGRVQQARVLERTGSGSLEKAVLKWARGLRFEPGMPGKGLIPFRLRNDRRGGGTPYFPIPGSGS
jgi:TonB family protein